VQGIVAPDRPEVEHKGGHDHRNGDELELRREELRPPQRRQRLVEECTKHDATTYYYTS
jgi:hypothetical protein